MEARLASRFAAPNEVIFTLLSALQSVIQGLLSRPAHKPPPIQAPIALPTLNAPMFSVEASFGAAARAPHGTRRGDAKP